MSAILKNLPVVTGFIRNLRGGSQPILVRASDGLHYVVKFTNNLQGANLPFNESMGSELYRACGLAVPTWRPLQVTDAFIDRNPDCWMQTESGRFRPESGLCFGSSFLGGSGMRLFEVLPGSSFKRIHNPMSFWLAWMIDICAQHSDNRQALFQEDDNFLFNAFFVDHGHMFAGPKAEHQPRFLASRYLDPRIYQSVSSKQLLSFQKVAKALDVDRLWQRARTLPQDWQTATALSSFAECLDRLENASLLQSVLDTMVDAYQRTHGFEGNDQQGGRKPPSAVLRLGVPAGGAGWQLAADRARNLACA